MDDTRHSTRSIRSTSSSPGSNGLLFEHCIRLEEGYKKYQGMALDLKQELKAVKMTLFDTTQEKDRLQAQLDLSKEHIGALYALCDWHGTVMAI